MYIQLMIDLQLMFLKGTAHNNDHVDRYGVKTLADCSNQLKSLKT